MLTRAHTTLRRTANDMMPPDAMPDPGMDPGMEDPMPPQDPAVADQQPVDEMQMAMAHLRGLIGAQRPQGDGLSAVAYQEGRDTRAQALRGVQAALLWQPFGANGVTATSSDGFECFIRSASADDEGRPARFMWWVEGVTGREMGYGYTDTIEQAHAAVEALIAGYGFTASLGRITDDVLACNPGLDPRRAVRIARKAMQVMESGR